MKGVVPQFTQPLDGAEIHEVAFNGRTLVRLSQGGKDFCLALEGDFAIRQEGTATTASGESPEACGILSKLVGKHASSFSVMPDGSARLTLEESGALEAAPGQEYESWQFTGPDGLLLVGGTHGSFTPWTA